MKPLLGILQAAWKIIFLLNFVLSLILIFPFFYIFLSKEKYYPLAFKLKKLWGHYLVYSVGIRYELINKDVLPPPPFIICPNHSSYLDILLTYCVFPHYFVFMGKQELSKVPLFNIFFKNMNILVDRKSNTGSHKAFVRAGSDVDKGHCIAIFPEATISKLAPALLAFKNGPFKLAIDKQVPIVPVTFLNNWNLMQDAPFFKAKCGPGKATIVVHKAIETKGLTEKDLLSLRTNTFNTIKSSIDNFIGAKKADSRTENNQVDTIVK